MKRLRTASFMTVAASERPANIALIVLTRMINVLIVMQFYQSRCQKDLQMGMFK